MSRQTPSARMDEARFNEFVDRNWPAILSYFEASNLSTIDPTTHHASGLVPDFPSNVELDDGPTMNPTALQTHTPSNGFLSEQQQLPVWDGQLTWPAPLSWAASVAPSTWPPTTQRILKTLHMDIQAHLMLGSVPPVYPTAPHIPMRWLPSQSGPEYIHSRVQICSTPVACQAAERQP
ncbi:hypothetical protein CIB48_g5612 [Xylaria polymorpha]|nr:hypothetical protein CIB48_g5612 [Xylaria polymorpha]